jgi:hypothetical protein
VFWKVLGWAFLLLLVLMAWFAVVGGLAYVLAVTAGSTQPNLGVTMQQPLILVALGFGYVVLALAFGVLWRIYLVHDVWALVAQSTTVFNLAAADNVAAQGELVSGLGEGFADGLDIAGF